MASVQHDMEELRGLLRRGSMQTAYRALLTYMFELRTRFQREHPDYAVSGLYQGYMDMTYFAIVPAPLKSRDLKIAIVFNYEAFRFEVWLSARNKRVQQRYWELVGTGDWDGCRVVAPGKGVDSILECDLAEDFDFDDLDGLTSSIELSVAEFVDAVVGFLAEHDSE